MKDGGMISMSGGVCGMITSGITLLVRSASSRIRSPAKPVRLLKRHEDEPLA